MGVVESGNAPYFYLIPSLIPLNPSIFNIIELNVIQNLFCCVITPWMCFVVYYLLHYEATHLQ